MVCSSKHTCTLASNLIKAVQEQDKDLLQQLEPEVDELYELFLNGQ